MAKTFSSSYDSEISQTQNRPLEIYDFYLLDETDTTALTLRFTDSDANVGFFDPYDDSTQEYLTFPLSRSSVRFTADNEVDSVTITAINVSKEFSAYLANNTFRGRNVVIRKIFLDVPFASDNATQVFNGYINTVSADSKTLEVGCVSRFEIQSDLLPGRTYQLLCPWKFLDPSTCKFENGVGQSFVLGNCDKTIRDCRDKFSNEANYGGFLEIPKSSSRGEFTVN